MGHVRRLFKNRPYISYLLMRVPLNLAVLMPTNLIAYYVKFVMAQEGYLAIQSMGSIIYLFAGVVAISPLVMLARRFPRHRVLAGVLAINAFFFALAFVTPGEFMVDHTWFLYIVMAWAGVNTSAMSVIPDPMLADI